MRAYAVSIGLLLVIFGTIGGYLYQRFSSFAAMDFSPPPVTIAASVAKQESWREVLNAVGTVSAVRGVELTSETSGEITEINFESGDQVEAEQLLVVLNDEVEQASLANQTAGVELADILFERNKSLIKRKNISQTQFDQSRADLERAKAQLAETEARLANKRIEAPFAGTMGIRHVDVGDYLSPGTIIATLQDHKDLDIDFTVPARYAPKLKAGLQVALRVDAFPDKSFTAFVTAVDSRIDPGTRNVLLRAKIENPEGLVPGMFATLEVDLGERVDLVTIPETAMTYSIQGNTVYIIQETEEGALTAVPRVVKGGMVRDGRVSVIEGLKPGDRVVSVGQNKLYRGVRIVVDEKVQL